MSAKRMDNDAFDARQEFCRRGEADRHTQRLIAIEARRARTSEEQKDAVIKALADALGNDSTRGHRLNKEDGRMSCDECAYYDPGSGVGAHAPGCSVGAALRLAGRL